MILQKLTFFIFPILFFGFLSDSSAVTVYNESVSGDLSNSGTTPTIVPVFAGSNDIFGTTGRAATGALDLDYFTINVPSGLGLRSIIVLPGTAGGPPGLVSFIGIQAGSQVTVPINAVNAAGLLGYHLYGATEINTEFSRPSAPPATAQPASCRRWARAITRSGLRRVLPVVSPMVLVWCSRRCLSRRLLR